MMDRQNKTWCPAIEFNETEGELILKAEVPGVELAHLNIHAEPDSVTISGVHDKHCSSKEKELVPSQLHYGQLQCQIPLPVKIQVDKVRAELIDGVLSITMPKASLVSNKNPS